jgi:hypothetical protein
MYKKKAKKGEEREKNKQNKNEDWLNREGKQIKE